MNLTNYYDMLVRHDWYYTYSDDHRYYLRGRDKEIELLKIAGELGKEYKDLYDSFHHYYFKETVWSEDSYPKRPTNA